MLRDITIGQHFPGNSALHTMDPRLKILVTIAYIVMLFVGTNPVGLVLSIIFVCIAYTVAKIPARMVWRSIKPLIPILIFTFVLNIFFSAGDPILSWWIFKISKEGIYYAIQMAVRIVCLVAGTSLLTYTTSPIVLTDAIERLLRPLSKLHFPSHELAMMMTIALRFIPTLIEETDKIMSAQKARGAELDSGTLIQRVKALVPVLIPLFLSAFRRADELATAMECRCYHGGEGRTRLRQMHITGKDIVLCLICTVVFVAVGFSGWAYSSILQIF
ncbi:MAG: energy-coupling factor transporter transmembrane component T family protein [Oscillospiraceae bacterium]